MGKAMLIAYDLIKPAKDYPDLINGIKKIGTSWCHVQESVWMVTTAADETARSLHAKVEGLVDGNDKLFVADVTGDAMAWRNLPSDASDWIKTNFRG